MLSESTDCFRMSDDYNMNISFLRLKIKMLKVETNRC